MIESTWHSTGQPCAKQTKDLALAFAAERADAFNPAQCVLVHGDAHADNTLQRLDQVGHYKLIDPDGLFAEPAFDLAIPMRDWNEELLAGDAVQLGQSRCHTLAALTSLDARAIWQWGFMERVSTGLYMLQLGMKQAGQATLAVADRWSAAAISWSQ
ncbi:MAG: aminoglycoside phosphotransferase family protein [Caldilineaceae bacterium]